MAQRVKHGSCVQVITATGSGKYHRLPSAGDSKLHLQDLYLRPARYRRVGCGMLHRQCSAQCGIKINSADGTGATNTEHSCPPVSVRGCPLVVVPGRGPLEVMLGFRTAGKSGSLDSIAAFHPAGSAGYCVACETLLEGARADLTSRRYTRW